MFGSESPVTFTSVRPDCFTASAAPGTAGEAIAMISFTFGWTLSTRLRLGEGAVAVAVARLDRRRA